MGTFTGLAVGFGAVAIVGYLAMTGKIDLPFINISKKGATVTDTEDTGNSAGSGTGTTTGTVPNNQIETKPVGVHCPPGYIYAWYMVNGVQTATCYRPPLPPGVHPF